MNTFLLENAIWKVILSNNEIVISNNVYINCKSDWLILKDYVKNNNLKISEMYIGFRTNHIKIPSGKYYFFRRMVLANLTDSSTTYKYFIVGSTNDKTKINLKTYIIPQMECVDEEIRILKEDEVSII